MSLAFLPDAKVTESARDLIPDECPAGGEHVRETTDYPYDMPGTMGGQTAEVVVCANCHEPLGARVCS